MTAAGSTAYTYTANGNEASAGTRTFTYDLENRLLTTTSGSTTHTYSYDGDGNRLKDSWGTTAATNTNYLWDTNAGLPLLAIERNGNNALLRRYTYGSRLLAESTTASNAFYYLPDSLGSTANLVNSTGVTQWTYTYEPYGAIRSSSNASGAPTNLMRFNGQLIDTVDNLYDLRARIYDPALGRFLQPDPAQAPIELPLAGSYEYAVDNPQVLSDPSGRSAAGSCITISFHLWIQWGGTTCLVGTQGGDFGLAVTPAAEGEVGVGLGYSGTVGLLASNADCLADLSGWFGSAHAFAGEGPGLSAGVQIGTAADGTPIYASQAGIGGGAGYSVGGGASYTWTFGHRSATCNDLYNGVAISASSK